MKPLDVHTYVVTIYNIYFYIIIRITLVKINHIINITILRFINKTFTIINFKRGIKNV